MIIATWNLAGRWTPAHDELIRRVAADVWLLTEVHHETRVEGLSLHPSAREMAPGRYWSAVLSPRETADHCHPHAASSAVTIDGVTYCASVLPWRTSGPDPWGDGTSAERTGRAVHEIAGNLVDRTVVWGGDWNHALLGPEQAGSIDGRSAIVQALNSMRLQAPTAGMAHQLSGHYTIDHVAVPHSWNVRRVERVQAQSAGRALSDHDIYVVDADPRRSWAASSSLASRRRVQADRLGLA